MVGKCLWLYNFQADQGIQKSIRLRSLIKFSGFDLHDINVFEDVAESKVHELQASAKSLVTILDLESYGIDFNQVEDAGIFFSVAGYAARSLSKILSCSHCTSTQREEGLVCNIGCESTEGLESGDRENAFDGGYWPIKQSFLDQVNRGGLWKPSDLCFITCIHIWLFYVELLKYQTA